MEIYSEWFAILGVVITLEFRQHREGHYSNNFQYSRSRAYIWLDRVLWYLHFLNAQLDNNFLKLDFCLGDYINQWAFHLS